MGVVSRRWMWVESMSVASGCGCKEVYRFPHIPTPLVSVLFCSSIPTFCSFFKTFFVLYIMSSPGERNGKFNQNGKFRQNRKFGQNGEFGQNGTFGQNGKLGHSCTNVTKGKLYDSRVSDHAIVHFRFKCKQLRP